MFSAKAVVFSLSGTRLAHLHAAPCAQMIFLHAYSFVLAWVGLESSVCMAVQQ